MPGSSTWEAYRDVARLGRKTRLPEAQRKMLWSIFERVRADLRPSRPRHAGPAVHGARGSTRQGAPSGLRFRRDRRIAGPQRAAAALPQRPGRRTAQRAVLRRRPRAAHLPAAVLVEGARHRRPRALAHAARQLPHLAPDPQPGRPAARARRDGRRRQRGGPPAYGLGVQRARAVRSDRGRRERGNPGRRGLDRGTDGGRAAARTSSASSSAPTRNWTAPAPRSRQWVFSSRSWTKRSKPQRVTPRSAPCISPKGWSSGRSS